MLRSILETLAELVALALFITVVLGVAILYIGISNGIIQ